MEYCQHLHQAHDRLMAAHDALEDAIKLHGWTPDWTTLHYTLDCRCVQCECLGTLRRALLTYAETQLFRLTPCPTCPTPVGAGAD